MNLSCSTTVHFGSVPITVVGDSVNSSPRCVMRSAIDWVLDQHKEKKPKDPTIRAKFDTYRFADHKERVIELLARVVTVSVETLRIVAAMKEGPR